MVFIVIGLGVSGRCRMGRDWMDITNSQPAVTGSGLPYGAVMATGAASQLAATAGAPYLRLPLLWLTVAIAVGLPLYWLMTDRLVDVVTGRGHRPDARFGEFTIPVGLAVVGHGLSRLSGNLALGCSAFAIALAWLTTLILIFELVAPLVVDWPGISVVWGDWFLAPAALLADGMSLTGLVARMPEVVRSPFSWLAWAVTVVGAFAYLLTLFLAGWRVREAGIAGTPRATWWIAAGCGGLAAAAVGSVSNMTPFGTGADALRDYGWATLTLWLVGSVVLVPVLVGSGQFLWRLRHLASLPPWPPTFSTGVYALGAIQAARLLGFPSLQEASRISAAATDVLWASTGVVLVLALLLIGRSGYLRAHS